MQNDVVQSPSGRATAAVGTAKTGVEVDDVLPVRSERVFQSKEPVADATKGWLDAWLGLGDGGEDGRGEEGDEDAVHSVVAYCVNQEMIVPIR